MRTLRTLACLLAAGASGLVGCDRSTGSAADRREGRLRVVCTTTMITDLARVIGGEAVEVHGIMKPGEDPHVYDVRPRDAQLVAGADLVLMNGLHLEATLRHVIENNAKSARVVALAETPGITPVASHALQGAPDPHCWFNLEYYRLYAERARDALAEADPARADVFRRNAGAYIRQIDELHAWVKARVATIPRERRVMVTSHDAFQYFGRAYDIDVYAVVGISTEQQPRPQDVARLEELVRQKGVRALFIETSVNNTLNDVVRKIAQATGARIGGKLYSDSLGGPETPAATYLGMIRHNVETIVAALR